VIPARLPVAVCLEMRWRGNGGRHRPTEGL